VVVRLLGPLEVDVDGVRAELGGPRPRALLAHLALEAGAPVPLTRIIETLWDDEEPDGARNAVQVYASRLRKSLGAAGSAVRAVGGAYALDVPVGDVDARCFEQLVDQGQARLAAGDPASAADALARALALWRGEALADLGPAGDRLRVRLDARHLAARRAFVEAELARGRHAAVLPTVEDLVRRHPLDEHLVAALMTALYRSGRQADALAAYAATVRHLDDGLGVDPGAGLRAVHEQVLRQQVPLVTVAAPVAVPAQRPEPADPDQLVDPVPDAAVLRPEPEPTVRSDRSLTRPRLPMVGRAADLERVEALLADPDVRVVTLVGPGGMGKTRLALEVAGRHEARGDVLVVALAGTEDPAAVLPTVGRAAGATPAWVREPAVDVAVRGLGGRPVLLVLDNLEQLLDRPGSDDALTDLDELLDRLPDLTLLCTSRASVQLAGELLVPLGPLPVPPPEVTDPRAVLSYDAARLFRDRARAALPGYDVTAGDAADVAAVCRMLDGLPLALELAAARVRLLPPAVIAQRAAAQLPILTEGPRHLPVRHRSIRAVLDWSVALLDVAEKDAFARLSVFAGGWTVEAAQRVCSSGPVDEHAVLGVLARLVDRSLVVADGSGRSWLRELVREYAADLLAHAADDAEARAKRAHGDYFVDLAERCSRRLGLAPGPGTREILDAESANLAVTLGRLQADGDSERLARLVVVLLEHWFYSGALADAERWLAVADSPGVPPALRAELLMTAGNLAFVSGDLPTARTSFEAAIAVADPDADALLARIHTLLAVVERHLGRRDAALERLAEARRHAAAAGAAAMLDVIDNERGEILLDLGRTAQARPLIMGLHERALADESLDAVATTAVHLALLACADGDDGQARNLAASALATAEATGLTPALADVLHVVGLLELRLGDRATAVDLLRRALRVNHEAALLVSIPGVASLFGAALVRDGDLVSGARVLAAGRAWRSARGLAIPYTLAAHVVGTAESEVAARLAPEELLAANAAGEAVPFGSLDGLEELTRAAVIDLRRAENRRSSGQR
jgi:predicted ATPase/DNA-binding SARP family transcriptional activator